MTRFSVELLQRLISSPQPPDSHEAILENVADTLRSCGVERVRYYRLAHESVPGLDTDPSMFLSWVSYTAAHPLIGLRIPVKAATASESIHEGGGWPAIASSDHPDPYPGWIEKLGLDDRTWIDLPVQHQSGPVGVLSFDWAGIQDALLDKIEQDVLRSLGHYLGFQLSSTIPTVDRTLADHLAKVYAASSTVKNPFENALLKLQSTLRICSLSIFELDWSRNALKRTWMTPTPSDKVSQDFADETVAIGEHLTGQAWGNEQYRHVLDFEYLRSERPELVGSASFNFHQKLFGEVRTVMYTTIRGPGTNIMIRAVNTLGGSLPFISEFDSLKRFTQGLTPYLIAEDAQRRTRYIQTTQAAVAESIAPEQIAEMIQKSLAESDNLDRVAIVLQRRDQSATKPHFLWGVPRKNRSNVLAGLSGTAEWSDLRSSTGETRVIRRQSNRSLAMACGATAHDGADIGLVPLGSGGTFGALLFPVWSHAIDRHRKDQLLPSTIGKHLHQLAELAAQSAEHHHVSGQAMGALQALSLVGHEMTQPLAATLSLSKLSLNMAQRSKARPVEAAQISTVRNGLTRSGDSLDAVVRLGHIVGRAGVGKLVGVYQEANVKSVTNFALSTARLEVQKRALRAPEGGIVFDVTRSPAGQAGFDPLVCDPPMLEIAILNLLRNAVKYSTQPRRGPATVGLHTEQSRKGNYVRWSVSNTGADIPLVQHELIFDAFTRFDEPISDVYRRGMGLGLYLCRQIARAHHGDVRLRCSSGPDGAADILFTLDVPSNLLQGPYPREGSNNDGSTNA